MVLKGVAWRLRGGRLLGVLKAGVWLFSSASLGARLASPLGVSTRVADIFHNRHRYPLPKSKILHSACDQKLGKIRQVTIFVSPTDERFIM